MQKENVSPLSLVFLILDSFLKNHRA